MKLEFRSAIVGTYKIYDTDANKKLYDVAKRSLMGNRYSIMLKGKKIASVEKNSYNKKKADIIIGGVNVGSIDCDWTNKLTVKLNNKWYISKNKDGYDVRSYGKIIGKVDCKYGLTCKYIVDVVSEEDVLSLICIILAIDIINYEVER